MYKAIWKTHLYNFNVNNFLRHNIKTKHCNVYKNEKQYYSIYIENIKNNHSGKYTYLPLNHKKNIYNISRNLKNLQYQKHFSFDSGIDKNGIVKPFENGHAKIREYMLNNSNEFVPSGIEKDKQFQNSKKYYMDNKEISNKTDEDNKKIDKEVKNNNKLCSKDENESEIKLEQLLKKRNIKKDIIKITEKAKYEIKRIIEMNNKQNKNNNYVLKLYFIAKGCNGLTHSFNFINKNDIKENDKIIYDNDNNTEKKNILLVIDSNCILYVINTILDYYKDDLTENFIFTNPNITSICPCGTSFHF
ncbi:iron-sulfur assembly protein, putative [Plasmodium vinckei vinckei]|uniref:Iron-sulfur assembly protein, putative n=1 Tax=Plasmodium vinckei vinckei TaxID=54757 RepID=A0A449BWQ0_PLAVN|nr:iron-sulfur assembly protein, putative [Plasmodium vinckei vinckei]VEV57769.1 iron-sulfur assembly protein, putative [Plasmodium vinckei vinckei]